MKVLFLPTYFHPEQEASSHLSNDREQALVNNGIDIIAYCATPTRGVSSSMRLEYKHKKKELMYDGHLVIYRFRLFREGKNSVQRAFRYILYSFKQFNRVLFCKTTKECDVMWISSTHPGRCALISIANKLVKIPIVLNLQDIFPDSLVGAGMTRKGSLIWKIGRKIEDFTYRNVDRIIVISNDFKTNLLKKSVPESKIEVIYNWVDQNAVIPVKDEDNDLFDEFCVNRNKFRVVYAGNLGNAQNIGIIIEAAKRLKEKANIEFVIFGTGGMEDEIKAIKEKEQLDNLKILPLQPYERVSKVYGLGNVCIVACKAGLGGAAMPSKTWSIMSAGRAVLANFDEGELKEIVENNGCGVFTKADDLDGFVNAIEELAQHPEKCAEMGAKGREFILNNLTREVGTSKYVNVIRSVANKS